jgi:hypothetical protein
MLIDTVLCFDQDPWLVYDRGWLRHTLGWPVDVRGILLEALAYLHVTATPFVHVSKDGKASHKLAFPDQFAAQSIANFQRRTPIGRPHLTFGICTV